jgi:hypothetical protein
MLWDQMDLKIPENKDEVIARILGDIIAHISHGNAAINGAILENIKSKMIDTSGNFTWKPDIYATKDQGSFDQDPVVLSGGKTLKIEQNNVDTLTEQTKKLMTK